jgi:subtilisin-like proprotein convertase family protein
VNLLRSSMAGFAIKTIFAGFLMVGLVACPENPDLIPESFVVPPVTGAALGVDVSSAAFTITGITAPVPISVIGGKYQIDSAPFTSTSGTVSAGQTVKVSVFSSNLFGTTKTASITVGGITVPFNVTTLAADTTPDAFSFPAVTNAALSTLSVSAPITVAGVNTDAPISISSGGEYSIDSTTNFVNTPGTVKNTQVLRVRATSSNAFNTPVNVTLTIGGVTGVFTITTRPADTTPDAFSFVPVTNAEPNTVTTSAAATIAGIDSAAKVVVLQGEYSINDGAFTGAEGTITNGQNIKVRQTSSSSFSTASEVILNIGGVEAKFSVTTRAIDTTPDDFNFPNLTGIPIKVFAKSITIKVTGFDSAPISVTGGLYAITGITGSNGTDQPGTIKNGDSLTLGMFASSYPLTGKDMTLTIGTVTKSWSVTTDNLLPVLPAETLPLAIADGTGVFQTSRIPGNPTIVHFNVPDTLGLKLDKVKVRVKINHTYRTDLQILIFAPNGSSNQIFDTTSNNAGADIDATFDQDSSNPFVANCITNTAVGSCTGSIQPLGAFSNLNILNVDPKGQWRIEIRDLVKDKVGTIEVLSLQLTMKL